MNVEKVKKSGIMVKNVEKVEKCQRSKKKKLKNVEKVKINLKKSKKS